MTPSQLPELVISAMKKLVGNVADEKRTCKGGGVTEVEAQDPWAAAQLSTKTGLVLHSPASQPSQELTQNLRLSLTSKHVGDNIFAPVVSKGMAYRSDKFCTVSVTLPPGVRIAVKPFVPSGVLVVGNWAGVGKVAELPAARA